MFVRIKELRSGLGRKFFILVFLAALLPMLLFASFSYNYVGNALLRESQVSLRKEARFYSTILYERLLLASSQVAAAYQAQAFDTAPKTPAAPFKRLLPQQQLAARQRLQQGQRFLLTTADGRALLLQPVGADAADDGLPLYLAELDVAFLLGDSESRNPDLNYCVFGSDARPLYCSR
ncbi:MAG: hypothetical protein ACPGZU_04360, partial [Ketobacter sp.]